MSQQETPEKQNEDTQKHTGKKKKHQTECKAKKRSFFNCRICGSEETAWQGIYYCEYCGKEEELFGNEFCDIWRRTSRICDHHWKYKGNRHITKCLTCGATEGPICPGCKKARAWWHWKDGISCKGCGYETRY